MTSFRISIITFLLLVLLAGAFLGGYYFHAYQYRQPSFPILMEAYQLLVKHGLKEIPPPPEMEYGMIRGMLQAYNDPYTSFVTPLQHELQTQELEGRYGGIGVELFKDNNGYWALNPYPNSPAAKANLQEGDRLLAVDEMPVTPETNADALKSAIRGKIGTWVTLTIGRPPDFQPQTFKIKREEIAIPSVSWRLYPNNPRIGILKVNLMAATTAREIKNAVNDLQSRGAKYFILDLRDNPGGYLDAGVEIARLFLKEGDIINRQFRDQKVESVKVEKSGSLADLPLVVLINQGSASAAEIAAGAIQVHQRAPLVGTRSFGKDTIQLIFVLQDNSSLHVTAGHWWIPGLFDTIANIGLQPDIPVDVTTSTQGDDPILETAAQIFLTQP